jgi:hypothetical protein
MLASSQPRYVAPSLLSPRHAYPTTLSYLCRYVCVRVSLSLSHFLSLLHLGRCWWHLTWDTPSPPVPDDAALVTLFQGDRPALLHAQLAAWAPALVRRIGARPWSESVRASFVPTMQAGVGESHPKTLLYRRALAIIAGMDPAMGGATPPPGSSSSSSSSTAAAATAPAPSTADTYARGSRRPPMHDLERNFSYLHYGFVLLCVFLCVFLCMSMYVCLCMCVYVCVYVCV